jgi:hypothetical protein
MLAWQARLAAGGYRILRGWDFRRIRVWQEMNEKHG